MLNIRTKNLIFLLLLLTKHDYFKICKKMKMFYSLIHRRAWLALCMLLWMPIHLLADETAKEIKIYFHDNAGDKISLYAWVTDKTGKSKELTTD